MILTFYNYTKFVCFALEALEIRVLLITVVNL